MDPHINAEEPPKGVSPTIWKKALNAAVYLLSQGRNFAMGKGDYTPEHKRAYGFNSHGYALNRHGELINPFARGEWKPNTPLFPEQYTQFDPVTKRALVNPGPPPPAPYGYDKRGGKKSRHTKKRSSRQ